MPTGFRAFLVIWFGQFVSLVGSALTRFAITIWAYEQTGSAQVLALVAFFAFVPIVIFSPVAGALVDRWNRKRVLIASDTAAGLGTIFLLVMYAAGSLQIWHLFLVGALSGIADVFQFPAFSAAVTMMIDKKQYARAHGLQQLAASASTVFAPVIAGVLLAVAGIGGVLLLDVVTFFFAITTLLLIGIPEPEATAEGRQARSSLWRESLFGFQYILKRPGLLGMQMVFFMANLFFTVTLVLLAPLVLSQTNNDEIAYGTVQALSGLGGVAGGLLMSVWGGPAKRVHGVFMGMALSALLGIIPIGLGGSVVVWAAGAFMSSFFIPVLNGSNQAIWQAKVEPDVQGKVFAIRRLIAQVTAPVAMLLGGFLAESVFEPAMMPGGSLVPLFGSLVGVGPGAGISLMFVLTGMLAIIGGLVPYLFPIVREVETRLPDHDAAVIPPIESEANVDEPPTSSTVA